MGAGGNLDPPAVSTPPADVASELNTFINNYYNSDSTRKNQKQIPMKELRHVIPLLVLHCFDMKDHALHKKVKGLWVNPPTEWPEGVPFCDPNNSKQKGELVGKPKKDTLVKMFNFLMRKYWEKNGTTGQTAMATEYTEAIQENMVVSEHGYTRSHTPSPKSPLKAEPEEGTPQPAGSQGPGSQPHRLREDTEGAINLCVPRAMEEESSPREGVEEESECEEYDPDYEPIKETMTRLRSKINMLQEKKVIPDQHLGLLLIIVDLLNKMRNMIQDNLSKRFFIEKTNEFEATVDIAKIEKSIPKAHREKWHDFEDKWYVKVVRQTNQASLVLGT